MTARVAHAGQRVVLAEDRQRRAARPGLEGGPEGGGQPAQTRLDPEALGGEEALQSLGGEGLLEGQLGTGVDVEGQRGEIVAEPVDRLDDTLLEGIHGRTTIP